MDKTGTRVSSRLDYFLVNQEAATYTTKSTIEPITHPFDHSEITITVDFDKVMRGPGFWKFNSSHLENEYFKVMIRHELLHLVNENKNEREQKDLVDLHKLNPEELQRIKLNLNPHEIMEQIHYRLKERIIKYSISIQRERNREKEEIETKIPELNEEL